MNFRFVHPLFDNRDVEAASTYMATIMANSDHITIQDGDNATDISPAVISTIVKGYVQNAMGDHVVDISNFALVQEKFYEVYANAYENFLKYANIDATITYFVGSAYILPYVMPIVSKKVKDGILRAYNPKDKYWDLLESRKRPKEDVTNPIIGNHDVELSITTANEDFIDEAWYLSNECLRDTDGSINRRISYELLKSKPATLTFRLLPNKDYVIIQRVLKLLHKHF